MSPWRPPEIHKQNFKTGKRSGLDTWNFAPNLSIALYSKALFQLLSSFAQFLKPHRTYGTTLVFIQVYCIGIGSFGAGMIARRALGRGMTPHTVTLTLRSHGGASVFLTSSLLHTSATRPQTNVAGYKYVNSEPVSMKWQDIEDRAVTTIFWTELFRGHYSYFWDKN